MTDINEYKIRKMSKTMQEIGRSAKEGGHLIAQACFALAYKAREYDSQLKVNERNNSKLKFKNKI